MRLKTLRKERPAFEIEGAVINGNRIDLTKNDSKPTRFRSNSSYVLPTSLNVESSTHNISSSANQTHEMRPYSRSQIISPLVTQTKTLQSYQAIENAYLEHGIRIRLSPTRTNQQSGRKSANSIHRHSAMLSQNPSRTASALHYATAATTTTNHEPQPDLRPFSELQQTSSSEFNQDHTHNVSYAQSLQINEEKPEEYSASSIVMSEHFNQINDEPEKVPYVDENPLTLYDNDPDLAYMSSLLQKTSGETFRDTIRRRAGLRGTFAVHRNPLLVTTIQPRETSAATNRHTVSRNTTIAVDSRPPSAHKIDKDILKHATRLRRASQSKDYITKPHRNENNHPTNHSSKSVNNNKRSSISQSTKSVSLEPLELLLTPTARSTSLSARDLPSIKKSSVTRQTKPNVKRAKSASHITAENLTTTNTLTDPTLTSSTILQDDSLTLMKTSPLGMARQSNSFDSGCYDRSSSGGDVQSLTSSSVVQISSSRPSARLAYSAARRTHSNKKVSFYEEPTAIILTTATYV